MKKIYLDFETRSKVDIKKSGAFFYAAHPSTEILCACWNVEGSDEFKMWSPFLLATDKITEIFDLLATGEYVIEAHNANFEWAIWNYCGAKKYKFPKESFTNFSCTAARAALLSLPRDLETVAKALGLPVEKDTKGKRVMMKMCKPDKKTGKYHEADADFDTLVEYCKMDVRVTKEVDKKLPELEGDEYDFFHLDFKINRKGVFLDRDLIVKAASFAERHAEILNAELAGLTNMAVTSASQNMKLTAFLQENGVDVDAVDKEELIEALKTVTDPTLRRVIELRQALALSSVKKLYSMLAMSMPDQRARGTLLYCGANRTGRWSGKGIQIQNLPRGTVGGQDLADAFSLIAEGSYEKFKARFPDVLGTISSCIRGFIKAPEGRKLLAGDFSAIEARVIFWLANHEKGLDIYRQGKDPYKEMAAYVYKKSYDQIVKNERQLGKAIILGCGFGMGHEKFRGTAAKAPYFIDLTKEEAKAAVDAYRTKHNKVKDFWYAVDKAAKEAVKNPNKVYKVERISFSKRGNFLYLKLPSGRKLAYFKPFIRTVEKDWGETEQISFWGVDQETKRWGIIDTYGGKLVENATQACARDVMACSLRELDKKGYYATMWVHDEIVCEVENGTVEEFKATMESLPSWASGLPLSAEVEEMIRYKK